MSSSCYRVYIRFGDTNCVRFFASGDGIIARDGLRLFEWIREPKNIARLRNGLQHVYEIDRKELRRFLDFKLRNDPAYMRKQMNKYPEGADVLAAFKQTHVRFSSLQTGIEKLEFISDATEMTTIPRAAPRKRSDQPGWLYLVNLDKETLEIYEFGDYQSKGKLPFARLTVNSLYRESPNMPPGYYIRLKLSELQVMWRNEWAALHKTHAEALCRLWKRNATVLQTVPHADTIPFAVLYGSVLHGQNKTGRNSRRSRRLTPARLKQALASLNRRKPSEMSIFESREAERCRFRELKELKRRIFRSRREPKTESRQKKARED